MKHNRKKRKHKSEWIGLLMSFSRKMRYDYVTSFSAHTTLFILISIFPMLMFITSLLQYFPVDAEELVGYLNEILPNTLMPYFHTLIVEVESEALFGLRSVSVLVTLYCASRGVYAIVIGMNAIYGIRETRNVIILYISAIIYVLLMFSVFGLVVLFVIFGNFIYGRLVRFVPWISFFKLLGWKRYVITSALLFVFLLLVYLNFPNRKSKIKYEVAGAVFSTVCSMAFSYGFSYYIDHFSNYSKMYGSLATTVIFIFWIYGTMNIIFAGAEINVVLRKFAEYGYNYHRVFAYYNQEYEGDLITKNEDQK